MKLTEEQKDQVINFGAFDYSIEKIASILEIDEEIVKNQFKNESSELSVLFKKGKDRADYVLDLKLFNMAKAGDIKALDKLENRKFHRKQNR
jgi:predicted DNA-binding protein YlxM (UPF0122 family)